MALTSFASVTVALGLLGAALLGPRRHLWLLLLLASYGLYATWGGLWLPAILLVVTLACWACGLLLVQVPPERRGLLLCLGIGLCVSPLLFLRSAGLLGLGPFVSVGISYYSLQAVSYLLDVQQGVVGAERHLGRFALHLAFFPKLIQGPIERAANLLPQLELPPRPRPADIGAGSQLLLWGLFQKVFVADRLAPFVATAYAHVDQQQGVSLLVGTYFFAAQLYFDFAGYTDMALGTGRLLAIRLTPNFNSPYLASSIAEFWRRWHISLSSWLLDYIFRPLQLGLRGWRTWGTPLALVITFLVSGVWHGVGWGFVFWGLLHGIYLAFSVLSGRGRRTLQRSLGLAESRWLRPLQVALTFHLVCFSWIFFRAPSLGDAFTAVRRLCVGLPSTLSQVAQGRDLESLLFLGQGRGRFVLALTAVAVATALRAYLRKVGTAGGGSSRDLLGRWRSPWLQTAVFAWMLYCVLFAGTAAQSFLYEQF